MTEPVEHCGLRTRRLFKDGDGLYTGPGRPRASISVCPSTWIKVAQHELTQYFCTLKVLVHSSLSLAFPTLLVDEESLSPTKSDEGVIMSSLVVAKD